jgi:hypothetical protein
LADRLEAVLARLDALESINAIKELKARYWRACDRQRPDEVRECFAPKGAVIDYQGFPRFDDREGFVQLYRELGCRPGVMDMHHGQNPQIRLDGPDAASGQWDVYFFGLDLNARTTIQLAGEYADDYVRQDGRWYMQASRFTRTSFLMQSIDKDGASRCIGFGEQLAPAFGQT